jgi:hypothetical protein
VTAVTAVNQEGTEEERRRTGGGTEEMLEQRLIY